MEIKILEPINRLAKRFRAFVLSEKENIPHSLRSHGELIESIKNGEPLQAENSREEYARKFAQLIIDKIQAGLLGRLQDKMEAPIAWE